MAREIPESYQGLRDKAVRGSRTAAVRLFCLECMGYIPRKQKGESSADTDQP